MDETLKNIISSLGGREIGIDGTFKFHCTCCGKCCTHREDILLNPRDVYNMSRELGMSPEKLVKKYCEVYAGEDSRVPIVRVKPKGHVKRCPLLKDRKCMVHKSKPSVWGIVEFPLRMNFLSNGREGYHGDKHNFQEDGKEIQAPSNGIGMDSSLCSSLSAL